MHSLFHKVHCSNDLWCLMESKNLIIVLFETNGRPSAANGWLHPWPFDSFQARGAD